MKYKKNHKIFKKSQNCEENHNKIIQKQLQMRMIKK